MDELAPIRRLEIHAILEELISPNKVYFQAPSGIKLIYPCIIYELDGLDTTYADSIKYKNKRRYLVTVIDRDPDSEIPNKILSLDYCQFDRHFTLDNLNHYVFTLYY